MKVKHKYADGGKIVRGSSSPASPGITGAVKDAVKSVGDYMSSTATKVKKGPGQSIHKKRERDLGI